MMKNLLFIVNDYLEQSDWKDLAFVKLCLCSVGIIIGLFVPVKAKKPVLTASACVFVLTYLPLMAKLFHILFRKPYSRDF